MLESSTSCAVFVRLIPASVFDFVANETFAPSLIVCMYLGYATECDRSRILQVSHVC